MESFVLSFCFCKTFKKILPRVDYRYNSEIIEVEKFEIAFLQGSNARINYNTLIGEI